MVLRDVEQLPMPDVATRLGAFGSSSQIAPHAGAGGTAQSSSQTLGYAR